MSGLAEILDENTGLRRDLASRDELLRVQGERLRAQEELLAKKEELLHQMQTKVEAIERKATTFEEALKLIEKKRELARAERFIADANQPTLFDEAQLQLPPRDPEVAAGEEGEPPDQRRRSRADGGHPRKGRRKLDAEDLGLPIRTVFAPAGEVPGGEVVGTSATTSYRVEYTPGAFYVVMTVREQKTCPDGTVWTAPDPFLIPRAMCGDGTLAQVVTDKFEDHLPLHRQAKRFDRLGLSFATNVLSGWIRLGFEQVRPLVRAIGQQVIEDQLVLSDDTGHPVQDGGDGTLRKGRFWVFSDQRQAFYAFSDDKRGVHPLEILRTLGLKGGTIVADGGSEYDAVEAQLGLIRGGCWSHFRRYFTNAAVLEERAKLILPTFHDLFMLERELAALGPEDRLAVRQARSAPLVDGIYTFIHELGPQLRPGGLLAKACGYGLSQQSRMRLFLSDGRVPLHNNLSELLLRQAVVGRKNYLFSRSSGGAEAAAGWYTLVQSAKLQGLVPGAYLYDVFKRLPPWPSNRVGELTPLNWRLAVEAGTLEPIPWGEFPK